MPFYNGIFEVCLVKRTFPLNLSPKSHKIFFTSKKKLLAKSFIIVVIYYSYKLVQKLFLYFSHPFHVKARNLGEKPFKIHFLRRICAVYCSGLLAIGAGEGGLNLETFYEGTNSVMVQA